MQIKYSLSLLILFTFYQTSLMPAHAESDTPSAVHQEREAYAHDFAQIVLNILHDHKKSYDDRKNILRQAFSDSVDIDWIAKFVLGRAWKDATPAQRDRYTALYRRFLTETYVTNFAENPSKSIYGIKIFSVNDKDNNEFTVRTQMQLMNQVNLKVDYLIAEKDTHYKVHDIVIENVSLISSHRAEFASLATQQGVDGVIKKLEQLMNTDKKEFTLSMK